MEEILVNVELIIELFVLASGYIVAFLVNKKYHLAATVLGAIAGVLESHNKAFKYYREAIEDGNITPEERLKFNELAGTAVLKIMEAIYREDIDYGTVS